MNIVIKHLVGKRKKIATVKKILKTTTSFNPKLA
jgi:hypothetical protein